jgi:hypothetical protein
MLRLEAQYGHQTGCDMIPLMLQADYKPRGWLGMLLGSRLWYGFYGETLETEEAFETQITALCRELGGRATLGQLTEQHTTASASPPRAPRPSPPRPSPTSKPVAPTTAPAKPAPTSPLAPVALPPPAPSTCMAPDACSPDSNSNIGAGALVTVRDLERFLEMQREHDARLLTSLAYERTLSCVGGVSFGMLLSLAFVAGLTARNTPP